MSDMRELCHLLKDLLREHPSSTAARLSEQCSQPKEVVNRALYALAQTGEVLQTPYDPLQRVAGPTFRLAVPPNLQVPPPVVSLADPGSAGPASPSLAGRCPPIVQGILDEASGVFPITNVWVDTSNSADLYKEARALASERSGNVVRVAAFVNNVFNVESLRLSREEAREAVVLCDSATVAISMHLGFLAAMLQSRGDTAPRKVVLAAKGADVGCIAREATFLAPRLDVVVASSKATLCAELVGSKARTV